MVQAGWCASDDQVSGGIRRGGQAVKWVPALHEPNAWYGCFTLPTEQSSPYVWEKVQAQSRTALGMFAAKPASGCGASSLPLSLVA